MIYSQVNRADWGADRQSSGLLTNILVADREYEEGGGTSSRDRFRLFRGGKGQGTVALLGLRFGIQGSYIVYSAEVRVERRLHCGIAFGNPGYGYRFFRGGEGQGTVALLGLRLESRVRISFIPRR